VTVAAEWPGAPPASMGPQLASIRLQSAVSLVVEVIVLTGLYGLLAAVIRRRARRRSRTSAGPS
jgi:ABC-type nitrate/sulfonate/bicarbonate transport system permease component